MKKGFTLLELLVVILIIGILATLGLAQYNRVVEKSHKAEVSDLVAQFRKVANAFYDRCGTFNGPGDCDLQNLTFGISSAADSDYPMDCRASNFFEYDINANGDNWFSVRAIRCGALGKAGNPTFAGQEMTVTVTYPGASDVWDYSAGAMYR